MGSRTRLVALAVLAVALVGCGGEDDEGDHDPGRRVGTVGTQAHADSETVDARSPDADGDVDAGTIAREEYIERADRICREVQARLGGGGAEIRRLVRALARDEIGRREYYRRTAAITADAAQIARRALARLKNLPRPRSRRAALDEYLDLAADVPRLLAAQAALQRKGQVRQVAELTRELASGGARRRAAARRFGFVRCGGS